MRGETPQRDAGYLLFIVALSVLSIVLIAFATLVPLNDDARRILEYADLVICICFLGDFIVTLTRAQSKSRYLLTWGWLDLLSSIPALDVLRVGRLARVVRILRMLRTVRSARMLGGLLLERRTENAPRALLLIGVVLLTAASVAILQVESEPESTIRTPEDAVWWSISSLTTAGYGNLYPVTREGRIIAALLTLIGVGLIGTASGLMAAWFLAPRAKQESIETAQLRRELAELRVRVDQQLQRESSSSNNSP